MRKLPFILIVLFISAFSACSTDFEVNEDWKEIDIIYGLLDVKDTVHYVKINKAFLNKNEDAYRLAGIEDSIFHNDSLTVKIQEWKNGQMMQETFLEKVYLNNKDSGIFAFPGQYLYRLPVGYKLNTSYTYKLFVKNASTGVEVIAETPILDTVKFVTPSIFTPTIRFVRGQLTTTNYTTGKNAKFYEMVMDINYQETDTNNVTVHKSLRWPVYSKFLTSGLGGNQDILYRIKGDDFFKFLIDNIPVNDNVKRKFKTFDIHVTGGGEEIYYYMNVYQPTIGVVQKKPEYTNIQNGQGVFSSRSKISFSVTPTSTTVDEMNKPDNPAAVLNFEK